MAQPPSAVQDRNMTLYRRNLPHLEKPGGTYFVTFKTLNDFILPPKAKDLVLKHCLHGHGTQYQLHATVVMSNHVHLLFTPMQDGEEYIRLAMIMNGIKGASSHSVNKLLQRKGNLWRDESFDHLIRIPGEFDETMLYIQMNAIQTGVRRPEDYPWYWREPAQPGAAVPRRRKNIIDPVARTSLTLGSHARSRVCCGIQLTRNAPQISLHRLTILSNQSE